MNRKSIIFLVLASIAAFALWSTRSSRAAVPRGRQVTWDAPV
jgi:hypothetical protein